MKNKAELFQWVVRVIKSCNNYTQLINAEKLIKLFWLIHKDDSDIMIDCEGLENCYYYQCNELK